MNDNPWTDRFIKREMLPAGELARRFNVANPRAHPESQEAAVEASLDTIGWVDEISLSTNGDGPASLEDNPDAVMFDGHDRVKLALMRGGEGMLCPCNWYQLSPEETDFALLVKDQTAAMAEIIPEKLAALMQRAKALTVAPGLQGMLERLKEQVANGMFDSDAINFKEYDESAADDVKYIECPNCGQQIPK